MEKYKVPKTNTHPTEGEIGFMERLDKRTVPAMIPAAPA